METKNKYKITRTIFVSIVMILFALMFFPFAGALLLAALCAFALHDYIGYITARGIRRRYATLLLTFGVLIFIATPIVYIILRAINVVKGYSAETFRETPIYQSTEKLLHDLTEYGTSLAGRFGLDISQLLRPNDLLSTYSGDIGSYATTLVTKIPEFGLNLFVFFLALYYFLNEAQTIKAQFMKFNLLSKKETNNIIRIIKSSSHLTFVASFLIGVVQASIVSGVAYFCGFDEFFVIFIITAVFSLIPVLGSAPTALFLMLIAFIQGNTGGAIAMLVASIVAGSVDNLIKPIILNSSGEDEMHPILALLTLIGAILIYGAIGLLLGPIITQLALNLLPSLMTGESDEKDENSGEIQAPQT